MFEDTFLFSDTVWENLAFAARAGVEQGRRGSTEVDPAEVERAARLAGADDFIRELPDGYETMLGEHGFSLSGGQRQRLAIARAILADPRVLILDDATSAVDPTKEHEIRAALAEVMRGRTTLIIAHRPATIALADRVVLMDEQGRVAATGTHAHLLATSEAYRRVLADVSEGHEARDDRAAETPDVDVEVDADVATDDDDLRYAPDIGRRTLRLLRPWRWQLVAVSLFILGQAALMTAGPALISFGIDEGVSKGDVDTVTLASLLFIAAAAGAYVFGRAAIYGVSKAGEAFLLDLRSRVFHHIMGMSMGFFDRTRTGLLVSRMTADVEALQDLISQGLAVFVVSARAGHRDARRDVPPELAARGRRAADEPDPRRRDRVVPAHVESGVPARS